MKKTLSFKQHKIKKKILILLDGEECGSIEKNTASFLGWNEGESVASDEILNVIERENAAEALRKALDFLSRAIKTQKQLEDYLKEKGFEDRHVKYAIDRVKEYGYINDRYFATEFARSALKRGKGRYYILKKLTEKGVFRELRDEILESIDEDEELDAAIGVAQKLYAQNRDKELHVLKSKMVRNLNGAGFSWETVKAATETVLGEDE